MKRLTKSLTDRQTDAVSFCIDLFDKRHYVSDS